MNLLREASQCRLGGLHRVGQLLRHRHKLTHLVRRGLKVGAAKLVHQCRQSLKDIAGLAAAAYKLIKIGQVDIDAVLRGDLRLQLLRRSRHGPNRRRLLFPRRGDVAAAGRRPAAGLGLLDITHHRLDGVTVFLKIGQILRPLVSLAC